MNTAVLNGAVLDGTFAFGPVPVAPADLLAAIKAAYDANPPSPLPLYTERVGLDQTQPYAELLERATIEAMRTSTDIFAFQVLALRVYAGTLAAAADPAETIAEWFDERSFRFTTADRLGSAGQFHRGEPKVAALPGRGRTGVQYVFETCFTGHVIRSRKASVA